jgi:hypothetical protein
MGPLLESLAAENPSAYENAVTVAAEHPICPNTATPPTT